MEVQVLHGYRTLLYPSQARIALDFEHNRLVAAQLAQELVDQVLDAMREGWCFGEVASQYRTAGFVPSRDRDGVVRLLLREPVAEIDQIEDADGQLGDAPVAPCSIARKLAIK
jgi:hypothetical protein